MLRKGLIMYLGVVSESTDVLSHTISRIAPLLRALAVWGLDNIGVLSVRGTVPTIAQKSLVGHSKGDAAWKMAGLLHEVHPD